MVFWGEGDFLASDRIYCNKSPNKELKREQWFSSQLEKEG